VNIENVFINRMMDDVRDLHHARNLQQFIFLGELKMKKWRDVYLQPDAATWFQDTYLVEQWRCWFLSASGTPGVFPSTQHLESLHKHMKNTDLHFLRATIEDLLAHILQDVLSNHAASFVRDSIRRVPAETPRIFVQEATLIVQHNGDHRANFNGMLASPGPIPEALYFNVKPITSEKTYKNHTNVTEERMLRHEAGLSGDFEGITDDANFRREFMGLYKVWWCVQRGMVVCECKSFWCLLRCPHALVFSHQVLREEHVSMSLEKVCRVKKSAKIFYKSWKSSKKSSATKGKSKVSSMLYVYTNAYTHAYTTLC
jgi:hypothetical protein